MHINVSLFFTRKKIDFSDFFSHPTCCFSVRAHTVFFLFSRGEFCHKEREREREIDISYYFFSHGPTGGGRERGGEEAATE